MSFKFELEETTVGFLLGLENEEEVSSCIRFRGEVLLPLDGSFMVDSSTCSLGLLVRLTNGRKALDVVAVSASIVAIHRNIVNRE